MQVHGPSHVHSSQGLKGPHSSQRAGSGPSQSAPAQSAGPTDRLDISPAAAAAAQAAETGLERADLVARVRQEIASGTYETPYKIDAALDRLLDEIG
ncbi:MAG: flagellar biosynthesis anti-sigma factor FlgM [Pirellulales bacterium]|nr:flagellar biosynthesis anti-sigma factor FlgM [Pirellulales bacterium]